MTELEDSIHEALAARAASVEPWGGGLDAIRQRGRAARRRRARLVGGGGVAVIVAVVALVATLAGGGSKPEVIVLNPTTSLQPAPPTTEVPTTATPSSTVPLPALLTVPDGAIWPYQAGARVVADPTSDPKAVAIDFAETVGGMRNPAVTSSTATSVTLVPRREDGKPLTSGVTITVSMLRTGTDGPWVVTGAASSDVRITSPAAGAAVQSIVSIKGRATGFEGAVLLRVLETSGAAVRELGRTPTIAGANGQEGPISDGVAIGTPRQPTGIVVAGTDTGLDIGTFAFAAVGVHFSAAPSTPAGGCTAPSPPGGDASTMLVTIAMHCDADQSLVAFQRRIPKSPGVLKATLLELVSGPSPAERAAGLQTFWNAATAGMVNGVTINGDTVIVDFADFRDAIPNASTSAGSVALVSELDATIKATLDASNSPATKAEYRINGSCDAFWQFLQQSCHPEAVG